MYAEQNELEDIHRILTKQKILIKQKGLEVEKNKTQYTIERRIIGQNGLEDMSRISRYT